jgi:hypothetical protein
LPQAVLTAPWIIRAPRPVEREAPPVLVCASGNADELPWYREVAGLLPNALCLVDQWPAIDWIAQARVVVGGAGYNTVHECAATGTPLVARPWPRKYDRQRARAERTAGVTIVETPGEAAAAVRRLLVEPAPGRPLFRNGVDEALTLIR